MIFYNWLAGFSNNLEKIEKGGAVVKSESSVLRFTSFFTPFFLPYLIMGTQIPIFRKISWSHLQLFS